MNRLLASLSVLLLALVAVPSVSAQQHQPQPAGTNPRLEVQLRAFNITQNKEATGTQNRPGDVIRYTADVRNLGPGDLVDYEMRVYIGDILQKATIVDLGGGVIEGDYIKFPPILQAVGCNCSNANYFKVKIRENVCPVSSMTARYETVTTTIPIACDVAPVVAGPAPVTGPESALLLILGVLLSFGAFALVKRRA